MGLYAVSSLLYPYSNSLVRETLEKANSARFADEFTNYLESFLFTLKNMAGQPVHEEFVKSLQTLREKRPTFDEELPFEILSLLDMANVYDLMSLYVNVN